MKCIFEYTPIINAAAGVLSSCFSNRKNIVAVDHITVSQIDPNDWELVFVLCPETTFKIRPELDRIGNKLVLIHTSSERGLSKYTQFLFPHWLFCVEQSNYQLLGDDYRNLISSECYAYNALLGRAKDTRTVLLEKLDERKLIHEGIISYHPGSHYGPTLKLDPTPYYNFIWDWEEYEIQQLYKHDLNYITMLDSTTRLVNGHFSSCSIPWKIYDNTLVTLAAETDNEGAHSFPTEKTWKPILASHPVIFYATPGHERFLESLGFEMYFKTGSNPDTVVDVIADIATGGYRDYSYRDWSDIAAHNLDIANTALWKHRFRNWLQENFVY